jgi:hypothetical protein
VRYPDIAVPIAHRGGDPTIRGYPLRGAVVRLAGIGPNVAPPGRKGTQAIGGSLGTSGPAVVVPAQGSITRSACNALIFGMAHRCYQSSSSSSFTRFFENAFQPISENGGAKGDPLAPQACAGIVARRDVTTATTVNHPGILILHRRAWATPDVLTLPMIR